MKRILLFILCIYLCNLHLGCRKSYDPGDWSVLPERNITDPEVPEDLPSTSFKVMSFNLALGNTPANLDIMIKYIKECDPDLVFLRQIDSSTNRSLKIDRPKAIADSLGMESFFSKNIDYQTGGFGNAILSKFPIEAKYSQILSKINGVTSENRSLVRLKVKVKENNFIYFAGTELAPNTAAPEPSATRIQQAIEVINAMDKLDAPAILVGNFNEQEATAGDAFNYLKGAFTFACLGAACPGNSKTAVGVYDYITFKDLNNQLKLVSYGNYPFSATNFLPMIAEFKLIEKQ